MDYTGGKGRMEEGGVAGEYDYYMTGATVDYVFLPPAADTGWLASVGGGPWFEHSRFSADTSSPGTPPAGPVVISQEIDQFVLSGRGLVGYRWQRIEASLSLRSFVGSDNITSAASLGLALVF